MWDHTEGPCDMHAVVKKGKVADILELSSPGTLAYMRRSVLLQKYSCLWEWRLTSLSAFPLLTHKPKSFLPLIMTILFDVNRKYSITT